MNPEFTRNKEEKELWLRPKLFYLASLKNKKDYLMNYLHY